MRNVSGLDWSVNSIEFRFIKYFFFRIYKLVVIGGWNHNLGELDTVEVIYLANPSSICQPLRNYPIGDHGMAVGLIDGLIKSCGSTEDTDICYDYDYTTDSWAISPRMVNERFTPRASFIDGIWLVSGDNDEETSSTTDIWTGDHFELGPPLPQQMNQHCQLTVNSTHVFFADNFNSPSYLLNRYEGTWMELPPMNERREYQICGLINNPENGLEAVVYEDGVTEIFNLNDLTWRYGPPLRLLERSGYTQLTDTFVIVGGFGMYSADPDEMDYLDTGARQRDENQLKTVILPKNMPLSVKLPKEVFEQGCHLFIPHCSV